MAQSTFSAAGEVLASSPLELSLPSTPSIGEALSPFRRVLNLSGTELRPLDLDELEPLSPVEAEQRGRLSFEAGPSTSPSHTSRSFNSIELKRPPRSSTSSDHSNASHVPASARYITVSAVLSRSGAAIPISEIKRGRSKGRRSTRRHTGDEVDGDLYAAASSSFVRSKTLARDEAKRREASNGSALEALGALLLQRDSSGKVANLSFRRHSDKKDQGRQGLSRVSNTWLQGVRDAGVARLGIRMPEQGDSGQTIAQRRARKQGFLFQSLFNRKSIQDAEQKTDNDGFTVVGTAYGHPTFEVGNINCDVRVGSASSVKRAPELPPSLTLSGTPFAQDERNTSFFGKGSAFALHDPPDAPPSPVAMPGAWAIGGLGRGSPADDWREEGALLLPPPLLDDQGSDAKSFEGLLGVRRMREQQRAMKELEKLRARNRPAHKIGILTAFGNFVRAAHAADRKLKAASGKDRPKLHTRHTEPVFVVKGDEDDKEVDEATTADESYDTDGIFELQDLDQVKPQGRRSLDSAARSLGTVLEAKGVSNTRESFGYIGNTKRVSIPVSARPSLHEHTTPRAPRLLPIYVATTHPSTPFALDSEEGGTFEMDTSPPTPRIGPTLLSLPPSPWIHSSSIDEQRSSFSLQLSMQPVYGPPGAPRLAPTALEIAPSPYAMSPSFPCFAKSPRQSTSLHNGTMTPSEMLSPLSLSPLRSPVVVAMGRGGSQIRSRRAATVDTGTVRMTPSTVINAHERNFKGEIASTVNSKPNPHIQPPSKRIFLLWFLIGDLGLKSPGSSSAASEKSTTVRVILELGAHFYGFGIFVMAHLVDLAYRIFEFLSMTFWFVRWMALNLTGQTVLARCIIEAYGLVQKEWQTVSLEDHEGRGAAPSKGTAQGLTRWQVIKGLIELACLQDVTRDRYMAEGAGLEEVQGWQSKKRHADSGNAAAKEWLDLGAKREADRSAVRSENSSEEGNNDLSSGEDDDDSDDDMVVTRQGPEILEFTKTPKMEQKSYFGSFSDDHSSVRKASPSRKATDLVKENRALVKTVQWASRLAISAYGLHVTLVDLPATFTPSGNRFSRQTFAHLSRLHHEDVLHADIQTLDSEAYSPTFYLVRDVARKVMVVSVRGTQSLQDIIVDLEMVVDQVELSDGEEDGAEKLYCHAGVLRAAKALLSRQSTLFKTLNVALQENDGFGIVFTGHSLGGAIASTVVLLLSKYIKEESTNDEAGRWVTHESSGLPANRSIRAITFAHPAAVNASLARRAGKGMVPLVLSVVLGSDIIPRCGHGQARELRRVLGGLSRVRKRKGDLFGQHAKNRKEGEEEDARVHVVTSWWRWKQLKRKGSEASREDMKRLRSIEDDMWSLRCDVENDLYTAVKQRSQDGQQEQQQQQQSKQASSTLQSSIPPSPWVGPAQRAKAPLHQLASRRQALDAVTLQNEESVSASGILVPAGQSILIYNKSIYRITSPLSFFSLPDFHVRVCLAECGCQRCADLVSSRSCLQTTFHQLMRRHCLSFARITTHEME